MWKYYKEYSRAYKSEDYESDSEIEENSQNNIKDKEEEVKNLFKNR